MDRRYGVVLPPALRAYFATVNGTATGAYGMEDDDLLGFWHLDQLRTFAEEEVHGTDADRSFILADHSIWVYAFAIQLSADATAATPIVVDLGRPLHRVAGSFAEFVERYLAGDPATLYPDPPPSPAESVATDV